MQGFIHEHRGPLLGAAALHLGLLAVATLAGLQWARQPAPVQLAIQAVVVDARDLPRSMRQPAPAPTTAPRIVPAATPPPVQQPAVTERRETPKPVPDQRQADAEAQAAAKAQAVAKAEATAAREHAAETEAAAAAKRTRDTAAQAQAQAKAQERKHALELEQAAAAEQLRKQKVELEQGARVERDKQLQTDREAELQRRLAAEDAEAEGDRATAGVLDEYRAALIQAIERNWIRPPTARGGLQCELRVNQAVGGTVLDVRLGDCNGDQAVRESIVNAVYRASPLPAPRDARVFERRLVINFQPTE